MDPIADQTDAGSAQASLADAVVHALGPDGPVASALPAFVVREGQRELAAALADAIVTKGRLIAEAGTGTGKTFAYLVPALLSGGRVLISTGTRNLQDQLFNRDLPTIAALLGVEAEIALLKGRANYVCWHHLERNIADGRFARREDIASLHRIRRFAATSPSGDRSGFPGVPEDSPVWQMATSTSDNCLGQDCPEYSRCFLIMARQAAQRADVVVVNHHLFCADLALREGGVGDLLPTTDTLIFDEAHQLPETATNFFGTSVTSRRLIDFARDLMKAGHEEARDATDWIPLSQDLEQAVRELRLQAGAPGRIDVQAARQRPLLLTAVEACAQALLACLDALREASGRGKELARCEQRAVELHGLLLRWHAAVSGMPAPALQPATSAAAAPLAPSSDDPTGTVQVSGSAVSDQDAETVVWAEVNPGGVALNETPLSVAAVFRRQVAAHPRAWIFVSATLSVGDDCAHFAADIGLEDAVRKVWHSPYDFARQGLLFVPEGIGEPSGPDFAQRVFDLVWPLVLANRGRAFLLCTTLRMVDRLGGFARAAISAGEQDISLLVQGGASRAELLDRFREQPSPVLIGSSSFWEGVDVPGRQLSLVVIDKLPFAPPDEPVLRARIEAARRAGQDPFRTMQLPAAAMALKQGAGRLIRTETDRGLLVVCDARLADKAYGRRLLKSLPPFTRTRSVAQALAFIDDGP